MRSLKQSEQEPVGSSGQKEEQAMSQMMLGRFMILAACAVPVGLIAIPATEAPAQAKMAPVVMKGHPEKQPGAVAVPQVSKPKPAAKADKAPKAPRDDVSWVPGDYYWGGNDWGWDGGYWIDQPWSGADWVPGHWAERWWGWTWIRGYWD